jgi:hypothetical protein
LFSLLRRPVPAQRERQTLAEVGLKGVDKRLPARHPKFISLNKAGGGRKSSDRIHPEKSRIWLDFAKSRRCCQASGFTTFERFRSVR